MHIHTFRVFSIFLPNPDPPAPPHFFCFWKQTYIAALEKQLRAFKNTGAEPPRPPPSPAGSTEGGGAAAGEGAAGASAGGEKDEEAANAIKLLTKRNHALQAELEEEKAEVKRRCACCLRLKPFFLPSDIVSTPSVCPGSLF